MEDLTELTTETLEALSPSGKSFVGKAVLATCTVVGAASLAGVFVRGLRAKKKEKKELPPVVQSNIDYIEAQAN